MRSGVAPIAHGPEASVRELLNASQWWPALVDEFVKTAAQTRLKLPQVKEEYEILFSPQFVVSKDWLIGLTEKLPSYRENLRRACIEKLEKKAFEHVSHTLEKGLQAKSVAEANASGMSELLDPLQLVLEMYGNFGYKAVPEMKTSLSEWYSGPQGEFAVQAFRQEISKIVPDAAVDWVEFSKSWKKMQGAQLPTDLLSISLGKLTYLFADLKSKVGYGYCTAIELFHFFVSTFCLLILN